MERSNEETDAIVVVLGRSGSAPLDERHPEGGDEEGERFESGHSHKETAPPIAAVSPARAISRSGGDPSLPGH
jgi:hypothetical protein